MMGWLLVRIRAVQDRIGIASQVMSAFCMVSERPSLRLTQLVEFRRSGDEQARR